MSASSDSSRKRKREGVTSGVREEDREREQVERETCRGVTRGRDGRPIRWRSSYPVSSDKLLT